MPYFRFVGAAILGMWQQHLNPHRSCSLVSNAIVFTLLTTWWPTQVFAAEWDTEVDVRYDNPWNAPADLLRVPTVALTSLRYDVDGWWQMQVRITTDNERYQHAIYVGDAHAMPPRGNDVRTFLASSQNETAWNASAFFHTSRFPATLLDNVTGNASSSAMDIRALSLSSVNASMWSTTLHLYIRVRNQDLLSLPHLDIAVGLLSIHRTTSWQGVFDFAATSTARLFPSAFDAQNVAVAVLLEQIGSFVQEVLPRVTLYADPTALYPSLATPLVALQLTLALSPGVRYLHADPASTRVAYFLPGVPPAGNYTSVKTPTVEGDSGNVSWVTPCMSAQLAPPSSCWGALPNGTGDSDVPSTTFSMVECLPKIFVLDNHNNDTMEPMRVQFTWPLPYSPQLARQEVHLQLHVPLTAKGVNDVELRSALDLVVPLGNGALQKCSGITLPTSRDDMERVIQHVFAGLLFTKLDEPRQHAGSVYSVRELQQFALLDGMLTLALLGVDEYFTLEQPLRSVHAVDVKVVHVSNEVTYEKLHMLLQLQLAFTTAADTRAMTLTTDFVALCNAVAEQCTVHNAVEGGVLTDVAYRVRANGNEENSVADAAASAWLVSRMPAKTEASFATESANSLLQKAAQTLQPNANERAVYFIDSKPPMTAVGPVQRTLVLASYTVS